MKGSFGANVIVGRDLGEAKTNTKPGERSAFEQLCRGCCGKDLCNAGCNITVTGRYSVKVW